MAKKIHISLLNQNKPDFKNEVQTMPKDKTILNWLIKWAREGIKEKTLEHGDLKHGNSAKCHTLC